MSATFRNTTNITEQGRAVVNGHRDLDELKSRDDHFTSRNVTKLYSDPITDGTKSIIVGELVFSNKRRGRVNHKRKLSKISDLAVFSSFNGAYVKNNTGDARLTKRNEIQFMGVSELTSVHRDGAYNDDEVVVQIGGTRTIVNNGHLPINVGDLVMWDLPTEAEHRGRQAYPGIPNNKVLAKTVVYNGSDILACKELEKAIDDGDIQKVKEKFNKARDLMADHKRRIIGKALSKAAPGNPFDILLGNHTV